MVGFLCSKNEVMYRPKLFETSRYNDIPKKNLFSKIRLYLEGGGIFDQANVVGHMSKQTSVFKIIH